MDYKLQNKLVELILEIPDIGDSGTRSSLLNGIPSHLRLGLPRSSSNPHTDIAGLIEPLAMMQLQNGQRALFIFIDNALVRLNGTTNGQQLAKLREQIEASFQPKKQRNPSARTAQSSSRPHKSRRTSTAQNASAGKRTSGGSFPHGYALIVGIAAYHDKELRLSEAVVKDAMDMHTTLRAAEHCGYANDHVRLRYDSDATADTIRNDLKWLAEVTAADEQATAIFYFSGHGGRIEIGGKVSHYLLPYDCNLNDLDGTAITSTELDQLLHAIRPPRLLVLLDSCYSGGIDEIKGTTDEQHLPRYGSEEEYYHKLAQGQGRVIIASSSPDEISRSSSDLNNSWFTHFLLKGLRGEAPSLSPEEDGLIHVIDLFRYVEAQIPKFRPQHPVMTSSTLQNFPIALYRGGKKEQSQPSSKTKINRTALREAIVTSFSSEDLKLLCADLQQVLHDNGIIQPFNLDMLPGQELPLKAQSLIDYCERRGWLPYLIAEIRKARPNLTF